MSDDAERPDTERADAGEAPDADAWSTACDEDLAAEKARRRAQYGAPPTSAADELRRLADTVSEKVAEFGKPFAGAAATGAAQGVAQQLIAQAKATIEPVVERNPQFFDHLAAAGNELLAAYRSAVHESERRWTEPKDANGDAPGSGAERIDLDRLDQREAPEGRDGPTDPRDQGDQRGKGEQGDA